MRKTVKRRLVSLTALVCAVTVTMGAGMRIYAGEIDELQDEYDALEQQQQEIEDNLQKAQDEKERQLEIKQQLDSQITLTKEQIENLNSRLDALESAIAEKETEIAEKEEEIDENVELFEERLRSMQVNNTTTTLGVLFGSDSFSDFLSRAESIKRITDHDKELVDKLVQDQKDIISAKEQIEADKSEVDSVKVQMVEKESQLTSQLEEAQQQIQDLTQLEEDYYANQEEVKAQQDEVQAEIDRIYAENANSSSGSSTGDYSEGEFTWPVPGYPNITSYYGWRFNNTDFHTGIDISGWSVYGKNIVAAKSGTVIYAKDTYTPGVGYGRYLIIDHGGGVSTLYGHTSELYVSVGDYVTAGQPIAAVGSTGWSTGPHLHFEIRINGQTQNPLNYF